MLFALNHLLWIYVLFYPFKILFNLLTFISLSNFKKNEKGSCYLNCKVGWADFVFIFWAWLYMKKQEYNDNVYFVSSENTYKVLNLEAPVMDIVFCSNSFTILSLLNI